MNIKPAIRSLCEIEAIIYSTGFSGGWKKRTNYKRKMIDWNNELLQQQIQSVRDEIRIRKAMGEKQADFRLDYARISHLEFKII